MLLILSRSAAGQDAPEDWTVYTTANSDLPWNVVFGIAPAPDGTVWFSCNGGVCSFDGSEWQTWSPYNSSLPDSVVMDVAVAPDDKIWAATSGGIGVYSDGKWSVINSSNSDLADNNVGDIEVASDGTVWIGTLGAAVMRLADGEWTLFDSSTSDLTGGWCNDIFLDADDCPWIGMDPYVSGYVDGEWKRYKAESDIGAMNVLSVAIAPDKSIWCGAPYLIHLTNDGWIEYSTDLYGVVEDIVFTPGGDMWVATEFGLARYSGGEWTSWTEFNSLLPSSIVKRLAVDSTGSLWVATYGGVARIDLSGTSPAFDITVDTSLKPDITSIPGSNEQPKDVGVLVNPDGYRLNVVEREVVLRVNDPKQADAIIARWDGTLLSDGSVPEPDPQFSNYTRVVDPPAYTYYRVAVPVDNIDTKSMASDAQSVQMSGAYRCSSESLKKLFALALAERARWGGDIMLNTVFDDYACPRILTQELPLDPAAPDPSLANEGYLDAFQQPCFNDPDIGLTDAWSVMDLYGNVESSVFLCVIDRGFHINDDFPHYRAYDFVGEDENVDANEAGYHAMGCLSISSAWWNNRFGSVGTGAPVVWPMAFRHDSSMYCAARAIRTAVRWGAEVVSMSFGLDSDSWGWLAGEIQLDDAVNHAYDHDVVLLAAAGNDGNDLGTVNDVPAEAGDSGKHPLAVGAIDLDTKRAVRSSDGFSWSSNYGDEIDIWAPGGASVNQIITTPDPNHTTYRNFSGTSCACPYVAGIVAMMRAVNPTISVATIRSILRDTANDSPDSRVNRGYVNAYQAVREAAGEAGGINPELDAMEPNEEGDPVMILPGEMCCSVSRVDPSDEYWFHLDDYYTVTLDVESHFFGGYGLDWSGGFFLPTAEVMNPGSYFLDIDLGFSPRPGFYHTTLEIGAAVSMSGDIYEPNNTYETPGWILFPSWEEGNEIIVSPLNFHVNGDQDYYQLMLPELPSDNLSVGYDEVVTIYAEPEGLGRYTTFQIVVFDSDGNETPYGRACELESMGSTFPDRQIRFLVTDYMDHRNYYRLVIGYDRMVRGIDPGPSLLMHPMPEWLQNIMAIHPSDLPGNREEGVPIPLDFPSAPETIDLLKKGTPPPETPSETIAFLNEAKGDFLMTAEEEELEGVLEFELLDALGDVMAKGSAPHMKSAQQGTAVQQIQIADLPAGMYGIRVSGDVSVPVRYTLTFGDKSTVAVETDDTSGQPALFSLGHAMPNPFNMVTVIPFELAEPDRVAIVIYNVLGERVREISERRYDAGRHTVTWDGAGDRGNILAGGVYFVKMSTGSGVQTQKVTLLK